jgi:phosphonate transport system substrate-binding protein
VKELRIALITLADSDTGESISVDPFQHYMERATGIPVRTRQVGDIYTSSIQALSSGQVDIAILAGGGYVNVREQVGDLVTPLLVRLGAHGEPGYYSSLIVKADSPYHSLADLKGKSLAVVDYNSTSGYLMPMHAMRQKGIVPETYFAKIGVAGGHAQVVTAVNTGQYDAGWTLSSSGTPEVGFAMTTWRQMEGQGMIARGAIRDIWDVGPVPNTAFVMRTDRPQELQDLARGAIAAIPYDAPDAFEALGSLPGATYRAGDNSMFAAIVKLRQEAISNQRAGARRPN